MSGNKHDHHVHGHLKRLVVFAIAVYSWRTFVHQARKCGAPWILVGAILGCVLITAALAWWLAGSIPVGQDLTQH